MEMPGRIGISDDPQIEGMITLAAEPSGSGKGPGKKGGVFFNPAMIQNRDLSLVVLQTLMDTGRFAGDAPVRILDGLTGSGIRAVRFCKELDPGGRGMSITGLDINPESIRTARETAAANGCGRVDFINDDLNSFIGRKRYHYIDLDPFGSPAPFLFSCLRGLARGGVLAVTATDTAALTGSVPRVARRRYGVETGRTHFMQELGARTLLGFVARTAASLEMSVKPLYFYSSDHFIRGYITVERGAGRTDDALSRVGYLIYDGFNPPLIRSFISDMVERDLSLMPVGPVWTGPLSDNSFISDAVGVMDRRNMSHIGTEASIRKDLKIAMEEDLFPPGGFDLNWTASRIGVSPPGVRKVGGIMEDSGYGWSRSRFSPTVIKTDAPADVIGSAFEEGGGD